MRPERGFQEVLLVGGRVETHQGGRVAEHCLGVIGVGGEVLDELEDLRVLGLVNLRGSVPVIGVDVVDEFALTVMLQILPEVDEVPMG